MVDTIPGGATLRERALAGDANALYEELYGMVHVFPIGHVITTRDYRKPVKARHSKVTGPYLWRVEHPDDRREGRGFYMGGEDGNHRFFVDAHGSTFDLRITYANDESISSRLKDIRGYCCDEDCDNTLTPIIARLPHSRGFLAGWTMGVGMASSLSRIIYTTAHDAAIAAHSDAEYDAEREREYQERERAKLDAEGEA